MALLDQGPPIDDALLIFNQAQTIVEANDRACALYGYHRSELVGLSVADLRSDRVVSDRQWRQTVETGQCRFETIHYRQDSSRIPVEVRSRTFHLDGQLMVSSLVRDLSDVRELQQRHLFLQKLYLALRKANSCYIRARTQQELFQTICQIMVEFGEFALARVSLIEEGSVTLKTVACAGHADQFNAAISISIDPRSPYSQGPTAQAILGQKAVAVADLLTQDIPAPWKEALKVAGLTGCVAVPICQGGLVLGAISFWGNSSHHFDPEMVDLLGSVGEDLSHALDRLGDTLALEVLSRQLEKAQSRLQGVIEGSPDLICAWDLSDRLILANSSYGRHLEIDLGCSVKLGATLPETLGANPAVDSLSRFRRRADGGETFRTIYPQPSARGVLWWDASYSPLKDPEGLILGGVQIAREITESFRTSEQLKVVQAVLETTPLALMIVDPQGRVLLVNRRLTEILDESQDLVGHTADDLLKGFTTSTGTPPVWASASESVQRQLVSKRGRHGTQWYEILVVSMSTVEASVTPTSVFLLEVTNRIAAEKELAFLRDHDRTTGLPNRSVAEGLLRSLITPGGAGGPSPFAILLVNLDRFEFVNELVGMEGGDEILRALGQRLVTAVPDAQVARFEGDEFMVLAPLGAQVPSLEGLADRLLEVVQRPITRGDQSLKCLASIGIACFPNHGREVYQLIGRAREALKDAKAAGRNGFRIFEPEAHVLPGNYLQLRTDLELALDRGELFLEFQPQWTLADRRLVGLEVLVRWQHPTLGVVPPGSFIAIAEDCGFMVGLGTWILDQACRQGALWDAQGLAPPVIAVNVSAVQFQQRDFFDVVAETLAETGLRPGLLELELTESLLFNDTTQTLETIRRLKTLGVRLSIDDFGTGYSSMSYLKRLAVDKLKIDQSFVRDLSEPGESWAIVKAIIDMAQGLGLKTIAEGVESEGVAQVLSGLGCEEIQGFLLGRPSRQANIEKILQATARPLEELG